MAEITMDGKANSPNSHHEALDAHLPRLILQIVAANPLGSVPEVDSSL